MKKRVSTTMAESTEYSGSSLDFTTYVLNLVTAALYGFGDLGEQKDIQTARSIIDILIMLKNKTRGNLTKEEETMLSESIHDLQMRYLKEVQYL